MICRSGAGALAELTAMGKPAVLVPLPSSAGNEQTHNARYLERAGAAVALVGEVTPTHLAETVAQLLDKSATRNEMAQRASTRRRCPSNRNHPGSGDLHLIRGRRHKLLLAAPTQHVAQGGGHVVDIGEVEVELECGAISAHAPDLGVADNTAALYHGERFPLVVLTSANAPTRRVTRVKVAGSTCSAAKRRQVSTVSSNPGRSSRA